MYIFSKCVKSEDRCDDDNNVEMDHNSGTPFALKAPTAIQLYSFFNIIITLPPSPPSHNDTSKVDHHYNALPLSPPTVISSMHDDDSRGSGDTDRWTRDNIMDREFLHNFVRSHVLNGIGVGCTFETFLNSRWQDDDDDDRTVAKRTYVVYQIVLHGEGWPLMQNDDETIRKRMEEDLKRLVDWGSMSRWFTSHVYTTSISAHGSGA